jgi:hypothetical protein
VKARITENGALIVTAETAIETYALRKWSDAYFDKSARERDETLLIETAEAGGES